MSKAITGTTLWQKRRGHFEKTIIMKDVHVHICVQKLNRRAQFQEGHREVGPHHSEISD